MTNAEQAIYDELTKGAEKVKQATSSSAIADRQSSNIDLIESHLMEKIKESRNQLDKLESVVRERGEQIRGKIADLTEIANTVLNATESLSSTIDAMLAHELKPL